MVRGDFSTCTINEAKRLIAKVYEECRSKNLPPPSFIMVGPPGVGKSEGVLELGEHLARRLGRKFIVYDDSYFSEIMRDPSQYFVLVDIRLSCHEPSDLTGIPREVHGESNVIMFKPVTWAIVLSKTAGILFLDELTNVQREDLISVAYRVLLDRYLGYTKLSPDVLIIGAGNRPDDAPIVRQLPAPLVNRCIMLYIEAPTLEEWAGYMRLRYGSSWCYRVYGFLRTNREYFFKPPPESETLNNFPTPRSWTRLALVLGSSPTSRYSSREVYKICIGAVGHEVGPMVAKHVLLNVPALDELLNNPKRWSSLDLDVKLNFVADLALYLAENLDNVVKPDSTLDEKVSKLIAVILEDSEEIGLTFLQLIPEHARPRLLTALAISVPEVGDLVNRLEQKRRELEKIF